MATDARALVAVSKVGHISSKQLNLCGMSDKRIRNFEKQGLFEKVSYRNGKSKQLEHCYKLTSAGQKFYDLREVKEHSYYQSVSPQHDIAIADKYFSLQEYEQKSWMTEGEIRNAFYKYIEELRERGEDLRAQELVNAYNSRKLSAVDAVYETEQGVRIAYEVVTNSYGQTEIQAKEDFADIMKLRFEPQRI